MVDLTAPNENIPQEQDAPGYSDTLDRRFSYADDFSDAPYKKKEDRLAETLVYGVPNTVVGGLSEIIESMPGFDEEDSKAFQETILPEGALADFKSYESGYKALGSFAALALPITMVPRVMQSKGLFTALEKTVGAKAAAHLTVSSNSLAVRMKRIKAASKVSAKNQFSAISKEANPVLASALKKEYTGAMYDTLKVGLATDLSMYAMLNESDILFPEDSSAATNAALFLVPTFAVAGISGAYTRRKLMNVANKMHATVGVKARNPDNLPVHEMLSVAGDRGASISVMAAMKQNKTAEHAAAAGDSALSANLNSQKLALDNAITENVSKVGTDTVYPGFTHKHSVTEPEMNTLSAALKDDYASMEGVYSIEQLVKDSPQIVTTNLKRKKAAIAEELKAKQVEISKATGAKKRDILSTEYNKLVETRDELDQTFAFVLKPDGSRQLLDEYKPTFQDTYRSKPQRVSESLLLPKLEKAQIGEVFRVKMRIEGRESFAVKFQAADKETFAYVSDDLKIILPDTVLGAQTLRDKKLVIQAAAAQPHVRQSLLDVGKVYHYSSGQLGKQITETLNTKTQTLLKSWTKSSVNHPFRTGDGFGAEALQELYAANTQVRKSLREIAGSDGTIPLFRGEVAKATTDPVNDLVSMSANPKIAGKFGDTLTVTHVDPEDVVAVVGGLGDEFEFIVRGNLKRSVGSEITNQTYDSLNYAGKTAVQHAGRAAVNAWNPATAKRIHLSPKMHHTEIDMVLALREKFGTESTPLLEKVNFDDAIRNWDDLEYLSAASKYRDYVADMDKMLSAEKGLLKLKPSQKTTRADILTTLNLPHDGVYGIDPMTQVFDGLYVQGMKELGEHIPTHRLLKEEVLSGQNLKTEIGGTESKGVMQVIGNQFETFEKPRQPVMLFGKNVYENPYSVDDYWNKVVEQQASLQNKFAAAAERGDAPLLEVIRQEVFADPARLNIAKQVPTLIEGSQARRGFAESQVQAMDAVNNQPVIQAVDSIRAQIDQKTQRYIADMFKENSPILQKLLSHGNEGDLHSFAIARHQLGQGWRGVGLVPDEQGVIKLALEDHTYNRELFKKLYPGEKFPENLYLPQPKAKVDSGYAPLQISELAAQSLAGFNRMSQNALNHINELRGITGLKQIPRRQFHLPGKNLKDKEQIVLLNHASGEIDSVVYGNTASQVRKNAEQEIAAAKAKGVDLFSATDTDLANYHHMELELLHGADDYSTTFRQTGTSRGRSFGQVVEIGPEVVTSMNDSLVRQYTQISRITSAALFEPELRAAELAMRSAGLSKTELDKGLNIWSQWKNRAMGLPSLNKNQWLGKVYGAGEDAYDTIINKVFDAKIEALSGKQQLKNATQAHAKLGDATPGYNPITDAEEFIRTTMKVNPPHSLRKHASQMNALTGALMLRIGEVGLALVNLGTLPTLIPVVAGALKRQKGQSVDAWKKANAAWSSQIDDTTQIWNPYRTFTSGMHYMFSKEGRTALDYAASKGNLKQEVVERMKDITAPSIGYVDNLMRKGVDWASFLVDKSEQMSRSISYLTFHNMGVKNLKLGNEAAHEFAHQMANRTIGDYRPNNKPRIYQGGVGAPFGLFMTFAQNYMQRVFGYLEQGQMQSFMRQMGLQAAFFGGKSLPGFNQYVDHFTSNYDGTENIVDRMDRNLGSTMTDAFLFGSVGTLTGLASYTRTDLRLPGAGLATADSIFDLAPAAGLLERTYTGVSDIVKASASESGLSGNRLSEIASRTFPVKSMKGWIELSQGYSVDSRGQVIDEDIRGATEVFSKLSSVRTMRDQRLMEEFSRQKNQQMKQQAVKNQARNALRSLFRGGKLDSESLNGVAKDYLKSGGEPGDFDNFMTEQAKYGLINKGFLKALSIADNPNKQPDFLRLMKILADRDRLAE